MNHAAEPRPQAFDALAAQVVAERQVPRATYRLQLNSAFTFADARRVVPYLRDLGISDCYASPILMARPDSTHGYDVCDHSRINPVLGGEEGLDDLIRALREHALGLLVDVVPNHMAVNNPDNAWWSDVLENGRASPYASFFDISWEPAKPELENHILLPILEDQFGRVLETGRFKLVLDGGALFVDLGYWRLPLSPETYGIVLQRAVSLLSESATVDAGVLVELQSILTALGYLPSNTVDDDEKRAERDREKEVIKRRLAGICAKSATASNAIESALRELNGVPGERASFDRLDQLLSAQIYRPAFWRVAGEEVNYRRFFDVNEMAALRVELPEVFEATHRLIRRMLADGSLTGLRVDHPDGLWDPAAYFQRLQSMFLADRVWARLEAAGEREADLASLERWAADWVGEALSVEKHAVWPLYVVAEKILSEHEPLPADWPVDGTTGYDFLHQTNSLFVSSANRRPFTALYWSFIKGRPVFRELTSSTKKMIMLVSLSSEVNALSTQLQRIAEANRRYRDFTLNSLTFAIREVIACLPVYRTYIHGVGQPVSERDERYIRAAVAEAKRRNPRTAESIFDFIEDVLLLRILGDFREQDQPQLVDFAMKFQQVSSPVMAKGVEDTAFYVYNRLISLNEVGGEPDSFGVSPARFHRFNSERLKDFPFSMAASSTHDTKRSEDVRARINVLSEMPREWRTVINRWSRLNAGRKGNAEGARAPDRNDEYLLYQTLLGVWPNGDLNSQQLGDLRGRIAAYMLKATREGKVHTSWVNPSDDYDAAVKAFVFALLSDEPDNLFLADFRLFQSRIAYFGQFNALSQLLLKLVCPGVPDVYQGTELWDYSLVDPDNRRPVDFKLRRATLRDMQRRSSGPGADLAALAADLMESSADGRIKLYVLWRTLTYRRDHPDLFGHGAYTALRTDGSRREHALALARSIDDEQVIAVVPRLPVGLCGGAQQPPCGDVWRDTTLRLPRSRTPPVFRNLFTGEAISPSPDSPGRLPLAQALASFPVALLIRE